MPEPRFPDLAHQELYESLLDAFLLSQTSSDFAKTFLAAVTPLQATVADLQTQVANLKTAVVALGGTVP